MKTGRQMYAGMALLLAVHAAAAADAPILSGCEYDYPPYCVVAPDGQAGGFSVELLRAALKTMGREVTFKVGAWSEIKQDLAEGRLQTLPLVGRTPEREALYISPSRTFPFTGRSWCGPTTRTSGRPPT